MIFVKLPYLIFNLFFVSAYFCCIFVVLFNNFKFYTMKKNFVILLIVMILSVFSAQAQAFQAKNFNLDIGYVIGSHRGAFYSPGVMVSAEKGIYKWIGVGAYAGFQYNLPYTTIWGAYGSSAISVPLGATGQFHFYQMISDLVGKEIGSDKLDLSVKPSAGVRLDFGNTFVPRFDWGMSLNARYFFTENIGVYLEAGYPAMGNVIVGGAIKF